MFRSPSISLLAVTACLLGGCEKREADASAEGEKRSSARSSLRASAEALHGGERREYTALQDVLKAIRRLPHLDFSEENGFGADEDYNVLTQAEDAIRSADPAQFEAIMKEIAQLEDEINRGDLRAVAIFHLVAGQDLLRAGEIALRLLPPGDDRSTLLKSLVFETYPSATKALDFWRSLPVEEQSEVSEYVFIQASVDLGSQGLVKWKDEGYRLNEDETFRMIKAMIIGSVSSGSTPPEVDGPSEYPDLITSIAPLEKEGVLSKGAADELMLQYLIHQEELGESAEFSGMPGTQARVEELRKDGFDSLYSRISAERPHRFFTDTGIHDLPMEKITVAWTGWLEADPAAAREWFGKYGPPLESAGRDYIQAGFARHALGEGNAEAAREWGSQIHDPELRAQTLSRVPESK